MAKLAFTEVVCGKVSIEFVKPWLNTQTANNGLGTHPKGRYSDSSDKGRKYRKEFTNGQ